MKTKQVMRNFKLRGNDSGLVTLPVEVDEKGNVVKVYDYNGKELFFMKDARIILWDGK